MKSDACYIIAEAGVNHDGSLDKALQLVDVAAVAGADAVKFQTFSAQRLTTASAPKAAYQQRTTDAGESQLDMLSRLELTDEAHRVLQRRARERGITFISTPFDEQACDFLETLDLPLYKVPSGELTNIPFLRHVARKKRPMILSTGMASLGEIERAIAVVREAGCDDVTVLHCTSSYPAEMADVNLRAMQSMATTFGVRVGYSDHTLGIEVSTAAVALGARVIEKHFTIDKTSPGPDHAASLEPAELGALVRAIRNIEAALGDGVKRQRPVELEVARVARKSIVAARDLEVDAVIGADDVVMRRPGNGLSSEYLDAVIGRRLRTAVASGELLAFSVLA